MESFLHASFLSALPRYLHYTNQLQGNWKMAGSIDSGAVPNVSIGTRDMGNPMNAKNADIPLIGKYEW